MKSFDEIPHRKILFMFILLLTLTIYKYSGDKPNEMMELTGVTMGTIPYQIVISTNKSPRYMHEFNENIVNPELKRLNMIFSTYEKSSEISKINNSDIDQPIEVSREMYEVLKISKEVYIKTEGSFDPTLGVLIDLWGFGKKLESLPSIDESQVLLAKQKMGFDAIKVMDQNKILKHKNVQLNLSAVAKGYIVDCIGLLLEQNEFNDYLVEIGGEIYTKGVKNIGSNFVIGLEQPSLNNSGEWNPIDLRLNLKNIAIATSGNYRNFYLKDGKKYAHIINPQTGYPAENGIIRVSIIAPNCATADAYATALMVMGLERSLEFLKHEPEIDGLISVLNDNDVKNYQSNNFANYIEKD